MSNYFTVLSDDWVQPQKAVYIPPSRRKEEVPKEPVGIKKDDYPEFGVGSKVVPKKNVLQMSSSCFKEKSVEVVKPTNAEYNKIKDDWYFSVTSNGKRVRNLTDSHKESLVETATRYAEEENHIPDLTGIESEAEPEYDSEYESNSDSDYCEIKEEIDIPSKQEMNNYVAKVEKLKKKLGTNLNNESVQKGMMKIFVANQVKVFTVF